MVKFVDEMTQVRVRFSSVGAQPLIGVTGFFLFSCAFRNIVET